ncbi:hypothetical protein WJX82_010462 [Trebouxia sp. C0006]
MYQLRCRCSLVAFLPIQESWSSLCRMGTEEGDEAIGGAGHGGITRNARNAHTDPMRPVAMAERQNSLACW